ncbi:FKBP-type peptidyl-prolyl cis-trans isomerase [Aquiflexum lacus]|uniref:FKBP-type peptidyl-prolyl cis-trans isomerase n=1 Tax=Aquiflexum lacus TaxID=2483805 RepID=UPI001892F43E|nr:FKBP-type peptidyl-prolyl cis-trans isomerase [Aquiflexum lacus]
MKKFQSILSFLFVFLISIACEPNNPFGGPVYDVEGNLEKDRIIIDEFLATAQIDSIYRYHDPTGVVVIVQEEGAEDRPVPGNLIYTNYIGSLLDGSVFDTNIEEVAKENNIFVESRNYRLFQFTLGSSEAISGFNYGFRNLKSGSKAILIIPSPWAYRDSETNERIPPNSVLMFEVDFRGME